MVGKSFAENEYHRAFIAYHLITKQLQGLFSRPLPERPTASNRRVFVLQTIHTEIKAQSTAMSRP